MGMRIKQIPVDQVIPYEDNPRKNQDAVAAVAASIEEFGFQQPIVTASEMVVIVGHTRLMAARQLGLKKFGSRTEKRWHLSAAKIQIDFDTAIDS
jgi:ParB-like chromosome segregation protein Spo0J